MEYELCHYGVKGMKWGVRKNSPGQSDRKPVSASRERYLRRKRSYEKTYDNFGIGGVTVRSVGSYAGKRIIKNTMSNLLVRRADDYIGKVSNPAVRKGLKFAKNTAIMGIEISKMADTARLVQDFVGTAIYAQDPNREARRQITG